MLHSYSFSNFRSFREKSDVHLTLAENAPVNGWVARSRADARLTTAMAVIGPNASGKTSLILPLAFLNWFIPHSFHHDANADIPVTPHFAASEDEPTTFEVIADAEEPDPPKSVWRYRVSLTRKRVLNESVERRTGRGQWTSIFHRVWKDARYVVTQGRDFGLDPIQAAGVRPNVSLISWAAQFGVPLAQRLSTFVIRTNMYANGRLSGAPDMLRQYARYYAENEHIRSRMSALLSQWDLGLSDVIIHRFESPNPAGEREAFWYPYGIHSTSGREVPVQLPFHEESSGTRAAFALLAEVLWVLETGGLMVYDELDSDLHPMMLKALLDLFASDATNPNHAQVIFTTHQVDVLNVLQKSQVMLVEKDGHESQAWRLDELKGVRSDDNRVSKYLAGAYGALPRL
jgi:uncharacterized protein